ncbi:MAG: HEAT repeat domain-containing protein [Polyangiaceae bacterium]
MQEVMRIPEGCTDDMFDEAQRRLDAVADHRTELRFQVLVWAVMARSTALGARLCTSAIVGGRVASAEPYVDIWDDLPGKEAVGPLARVLGMREVRGDFEGIVRRKAIASLTRYRAVDAAPTVLTHLTHSEQSVRLAAAEFVSRLDVREASPILIERLPLEDDPVVVQVFVECLGRWGDRSVVPTLRSLLAHADDDDLVAAIQEALRAIGGPTRY